MQTQSKISLLAALIAMTCAQAAIGADAWVFNPAMVNAGNRNVDISLFNQGSQLPGTYPVDIYLNGQQVGERDVTFSLERDQDGRPYLYPCLSIAELSGYGIRTEEYPGLRVSGQCAHLTDIPQVSFDYQLSTGRLMLAVPQISLRPKVTGIAPVSLWDDGIPALLMNYQINTNRLENRYGDNSHNTTSNYVQLNPGANAGPWRLRNQTNWSKQGDNEGKWQTVYTYAERGINGLHSRLTLGDRSTPGDIFDSVPFRGAMLGSDASMVPWSQRAFAPVVRGIARTQATVEVRQNGYVIYNTTVAPGEFALTDLNASGSGSGDLQVSVKETDGTIQVFTVPYQTPAISVKEGYLAYNLMAGKYRPSDMPADMNVAQATATYGLPWNLTVYSGIQAAEHFSAAAFGFGWSAGNWGALSLDATGSRGEKKNQGTETGAAWRLRYSKSIAPTNTTVTMTSYQFRSPRYNSLSDVLNTWYRQFDNWYPADNKKSSTSINLSQNLNNWGYVNLYGTRNDYWNRAGHDNVFGASYGMTLLRGITMSVGWSQNRQYSARGQERVNRQTSLWFSVPLNRWTNSHTPINATYQVLSPSNGNSSQETGLNGDVFSRQLHWDVRQKHISGNTGDADNSSVRLNWYSAYGQLGGNYSYSPHQRQYGAQLAGGLVAHQNGLTLGQPLGENVALIEAPGASGVTVIGGPGVKTDYRGYTIQNWLIPYQINTVSLDPSSLQDDVEINQTDMRVTPTKGAIVRAKFTPRTGARAVIHLTRANGTALPFGTLVRLEGEGSNTGIVGQNGLVYLSGLPEQGILQARWASGQCRVTYRLPQVAGEGRLYRIDEICR